MKNLSRVTKIAIAAITGIGGMLVVRAFADHEPDQLIFPKEPDTHFVLKIYNRHRANGKDDTAARRALEDILNKPGAQYDKKGTRLMFRREVGGTETNDVSITPGGKSADTSPPPTSSKIDIKTDKVMISDAARRAEQELIVIAPHVTQQVASNIPADITAVLSALQ